MLCMIVPMPNRFVILHHQLTNCEHWDLMLEHEGVLLTWQLPSEPTGLGSFPMTAKRIGDHRRAYLEYEGPIGGNRGQVHQVDAGALEWKDITGGRIVVVLLGRQLQGPFLLTHQTKDHWMIEVHAD